MPPRHEDEKTQSVMTHGSKERKRACSDLRPYFMSRGVSPSLWFSNVHFEMSRALSSYYWRAYVQVYATSIGDKSNKKY